MCPQLVVIPSLERLWKDVEAEKQGVTIFFCACALWTIWKARNDVVFNKKTLSSPVMLIYKVITLVNTWSPLLKPNLKPHG
jgi:hypothetical protein